MTLTANIQACFNSVYFSTRKNTSAHSLHLLPAVRDLDLEPIKFKLLKEHGWRLQDADRVADLYKVYLQLHLTYPQDTHVPTHEIDEMWHAHILDTRKYMVDCHNIFGFYLHHYPYLGLRDEADAQRLNMFFDATRERMIRDFSLDPVKHPDVHAQGCGGCSGCSSCGGGSTGADVPVVPAGCGGSDRQDKEKKPEPAPEPKQDKDSGSWWPWKRRNDPTLGLSPWQATVDPVRMYIGGRPDRAQLLALTEAQDSKVLH